MAAPGGQREDARMAALHSNPGRVGLTIHYWGGSIPVPCTGLSWEHSEDTPELTHPKRKEGSAGRRPEGRLRPWDAAGEADRTSSLTPGWPVTLSQTRGSLN